MSGMLVVPSKPLFLTLKRFWYLLECLASKGPQRELLQYVLGYCAEKI